MITVVENTLTAIKGKIRELRALGYTVTEVDILFGIIEYEER